MQEAEHKDLGTLPNQHITWQAFASSESDQTAVKFFFPSQPSIDYIMTGMVRMLEGPSSKGIRKKKKIE